MLEQLGSTFLSFAARSTRAGAPRLRPRGLVPTEAAAYCRLTTCDGDCELDKDGCKVDGKPLRWAGPCVGMTLQRDGGGKLPRDAVVYAVDRALEAWVTTCQEEGEASMSLTSYKSTTCSRPVYNREGPNANAIVFRDGGAWEHDNELGNTLGYTTVSYNVSTGEIYGADMELNNTSGQLGVPEAPGEYDLRSVITHELGHVLGIGHTDDEKAVMYPSLPTSQTRHALGGDDRTAICEMYAPDRKTTKCSVVPRGGFTADCTLRVPDAPAPEEESCAFAFALPPGTGPGAGSVPLLVAAVLSMRRLRPRRAR